MDLPDFNTARTNIDASQLTPPFEFNGVMMRVFPLRSKLEQVQSFVDAYLNVGPPELAHFRAFLPYVYLMIINYGKMSVAAANLGWIAQNEVTFTIPLLWYRRVGGQLMFHDFAYVSPFIYVDNDLSMTTGREVYGWPKSRVSVDAFATAWMTNPEASPVLARFSAMVFPELYAGMRQTPRTLIEIGYSVGSSFTRLPFDPRASWLPWVSLPKAIVGSMEMLRDYADVLRGLGFLREQPGAGPVAYSSMLLQVLRSLRPYSPQIVFNTVNLKQFRDAEQPNIAAYQAITNARMTLRRFQGGGLLGDRHILQGDPSGGFLIDVYDYPTAPIVESLGLEVASQRMQDGAPVHTIRPMFPMWLDVDMRYDVGRIVAWRSKEQSWHDGQGKRARKQSTDSSPSRYNTARGSTEADVAGPFAFPSTTMRVMPLLADRNKLAAFLRNHLGEPLSNEGIEVLPWGRYVYLVASSYEEMSSMMNDVGWWAERDLVFYVPARLMRHGVLWKVVLVHAYAYANSATAALVGAEVSGIPVAKSALDSPGNPWMDDSGPGPGTQRILISASTMVLPVVELGQKAIERVVVEVLDGDPIPREDEGRWRSVAQGWVQKLKRDLQDKKNTMVNHPAAFEKARAFGLQVLGQHRPIHLLTLKQFRDAEQPTKACYQAVIEIDREIERVHQIEEIETGLYVRIHRYPTQPIVETLGLATMTEEVAPGGVLMHVLEPVRPFWMKVSLKERLGRNLFVRAGTAVWHAPQDSPPEPPTSTTRLEAIGTWTLAAVQREFEPRRLGALTRELVRERGRREDAFPVTDEEIAQVVAAIGPQHVIDSILSEEWERWDDCRWLRARARIERAGAAACEGKAPPEAALAEFETFRGIITMTMMSGSVERLSSAEAAELLLATLLRNRLLEFVATQRAVESVRSQGNGSRWSHALVEAYRHSIAKLVYSASDEISVDKIEDEVAEIENEPPEQVSLYRIRMYGRAARRCHRNLVMLLAKAHQKPYYAIRRGMIANERERERVLPVEHCWDEGWYVGPLG